MMRKVQSWNAYSFERAFLSLIQLFLNAHLWTLTISHINLSLVFLGEAACFLFLVFPFGY
jgi:hypothetical protein